MATNRGKQFEDVVKEAFERIDGVSIDRLHDQTTGYSGSTNICDFIVYKKPYELYIECKSVHGNTLSIHSNPKLDKRGIYHGFYGDITDKQWEGLLAKSNIRGVVAGILCWWVDKDVTLFLPIKLLVTMRKFGHKSIRYDCNFKTLILGTQENHLLAPVELKGRKKRVFYDYDMDSLLHAVEKELRHG